MRLLLIVSLTLGLGPALAATPEQEAYLDLVRTWNTMSRIIGLERGDGEPPLALQQFLVRKVYVPGLSGQLAEDLVSWLDQADSIIPERLSGTFRTLGQLLVMVKKRRDGASPQGVMRLALPPEVKMKPVKHWLPFDYWPIMKSPEEPITEVEELLIIAPWRIRLRHGVALGFPPEVRLWFTVEKPGDVEQEERRLHRLLESRWIGRYFRKRTLIVTMHKRIDRWIVVELRWGAF